MVSKAATQCDSGDRPVWLRDGLVDVIRRFVRSSVFVGGDIDPFADSSPQLLLSFNTPFYLDVLVASSVLAEGVDLHLNCQKRKRLRDRGSRERTFAASDHQRCRRLKLMALPMRLAFSWSYPMPY